MSSAESLSALIGSALPPASSISLASRFAFSSELKSVNATAAPSEASRLTIPSTIPREPPVTRATLPANDRPYSSVMFILRGGAQPVLLDYIIHNKIQISLRATCPIPFVAADGKQSACRWRDDLRWLGDDPLGWEWTYRCSFLSGKNVWSNISLL